MGRRKGRSESTETGVAFVEAITVCFDPLARIFDDPDHSVDERREIIVGYPTKPRLLIVGFTERGKVRIVYARAATRAERKNHEEHTTKTP